MRSPTQIPSVPRPRYAGSPRWARAASNLSCSRNGRISSRSLAVSTASPSSISPSSRRRNNTRLPLALGVDAANLLHDRRGIGRYARALLSRWITAQRDRVTITLLVPQLFPSFVRDRLQADAGGPAAVARRSQVAALGLDAVWYPWNGMTWLAPLRRIATVHDV